MIKCPTISSGSGLKAALSFIYNLLKEKSQNQQNSDEDLPYFTSFKYQLCKFLNSEVSKIKRIIYSVKPQDEFVLQPSSDALR